jgi:pilus assembly protein Flp/PilA
MVLSLATRISGAFVDLGSRVRGLIWKRVVAVGGDQSGATAIEYGLIVAGISLAVIAIVFAFGEDIEAYYQAIDTRITARTIT